MPKLVPAANLIALDVPTLRLGVGACVESYPDPVAFQDGWAPRVTAVD
ncbi:hypothetical protein [Nocardioides scoriae]|nr:hypothetical protein [Nocardioides scoriae]